VGGEYIVHQLQYLLEYGPRFGAEMASSPHRLYMAPLGGALALAAFLTLTLTALTLEWRAGRRRVLLRRLPARMHLLAGVERARVSLAQVSSLVLALLCCQVAIYLTQENMEAATRGLPLPGLAVLLLAGHWTVLPLHLLLAAGNALILAVLSSRLTQSRRALRAVEALISLMVRDGDAAPALRAPEAYLPCLRLRAGRLGLRSPPLN
jgi:hypothetical protein